MRVILKKIFKEKLKINLSRSKIFYFSIVKGIPTLDDFLSQMDPKTTIGIQLSFFQSLIYSYHYRKFRIFILINRCYLSLKYDGENDRNE